MRSNRRVKFVRFFLLVIMFFATRAMGSEVNSLNAAHPIDDDFPHYFDNWECNRKSCRKPWGLTHLGQPNLWKLGRDSVLGRADIFFIQYSRPNDDTPAGMRPEVLFEARVGADEARRLLERSENHQFKYRAELLGHVAEFIKNDAAFYEVVATTYALVVGRETIEHRRNEYRRVSLVSILESTSGRYENSAELYGFKLKLKWGRHTQESTYLTRYPNGATAKSTTLEKIGTMATTSTTSLLLQSGKSHEFVVTLEGPDGRAFNTCHIKFDLPNVKTSLEMDCERFKFPPLLVMRSNIPSVRVETLRYRKPPKEVDCFASEDLGDGGLAPNSLIGAWFRQTDNCLECHAKSEINPEPEGGELLCGDTAPGTSPYSSFGNPKNPNLISQLIERYFHDPKLTNIPKESSRMQRHMDRLIRSYCENEAIEVEEKDGKKTYPIRPVVEGWVRNYANPRTLNFETVCRKSI